MGLDYFSDYASTPSSTGGSPWGSTDGNFQLLDLQRYLGEMSLEDLTPSQRANSVTSLSSKPVDDVMEEFRMNGLDTPYDPDEDGDAFGRRSGRLPGSFPPGGYLRQKSWPAPDASPAAPLPPLSAPGGDWRLEGRGSPPPSATALLTAEQQRVLSSLPTAALYAILRELSQQRALNKTFDECRFCKNNGERPSYYRAHALKDARGRVACPVLRAFVCRRCGARGDHAHTLKYCPLSTKQERLKSAAMMRSVRLASGRKRHSEPSVGGSAFFEDAPSSGRGAHWARGAPLAPAWAALEKKLME